MTKAVTQIFKQAGYETTIIWAPWQRCIENVKLGIWDASPGWAKTPEREEHMLFSSALTSSYHLFMSLKSKGVYWNEWEDLKGLHVGITNKYSYGKTFKKYKTQGLFLTEIGRSDADNLKKLLKGRIDIFPLNKNTAWSTARKNLSPAEVDLLVLHPKPLSKNRKSHLVFPKGEKGEKHMKDFNKVVAKLKESGELSKMFEYLRH